MAVGQRVLRQRQVPQATEGDNKSGGVSTTEAEGKVRADRALSSVSPDSSSWLDFLLYWGPVVTLPSAA